MINCKVCNIEIDEDGSFVNKKNPAEFMCYDCVIESESFNPPICDDCGDNNGEKYWCNGCDELICGDCETDHKAKHLNFRRVNNGNNTSK